MNYKYEVLEIDLSTARLDSQYAVAGDTVLVREITNVNANLSVKFDSTSAGRFPLHVGDTLNGFGGGFEKFYLSNDAVASGRAIIIIAKNIAIQKLLRITSDIVQEGIRQQVITVSDVATPIPSVPLADRINLVLVNTGANTVCIGASNVTNDGTATDGIPLGATESMAFNVNETVLLYGRCAAGLSTTIAVMEGA